MVKVSLAFQVGTKTVRDSFLWDHAQSVVTPEQFAELWCKELGLSGQMKPKVAHAIREQLLADRKRVAAAEPGQDVGSSAQFQIRTLASCFRVEGGDEWAPVVETKLASEYERRSFQEALDGRLRKRMRDSWDDEELAASGTRRLSRARTEKTSGLDDEDMGVSRRSGRARKEVAYAPKPTYSDQLDEAKQAPVVVDYLDRSVFPKIEPPEAVLPLTPTAKALLVKQPIGLSADESNLLAKLRDTKPKRKGTSKGTAGAAARISTVSGLLDSRGVDLLDPLLASGDGNIKYYKDNPYNRKLGRVGQVKILKRGNYPGRVQNV